MAGIELPYPQESARRGNEKKIHHPDQEVDLQGIPAWNRIIPLSHVSSNRIHLMDPAESNR
jgi:hypothetical protein